MTIQRYSKMQALLLATLFFCAYMMSGLSTISHTCPNCAKSTFCHVLANPPLPSLNYGYASKVSSLLLDTVVFLPAFVCQFSADLHSLSLVESKTRMNN